MAALTLMSLGAFLGGRVVLRLSNRWLRRIGLYHRFGHRGG